MTDVVCSYYDPVKAPVLHEVVVPAARAIDAPGVRIERHWLHGPHLRIALPEGITATATAERLREGIARRPSRSTLGPAELVAAAEVAGRAELVPGPYLPLRPDNSVRVETPDRSALTRLLGGAGAVATRDAILAAALDPIAATVATARTPSGRVMAAFTAMAVHARHYGPGFTGGAMSFLSHLEDVLHRTDPTGGLRAGFERVWTAQATLLSDRLDALLDDGEPDGDELVWSAWSATALGIARTAFERGAIPLLPATRHRPGGVVRGDARSDEAELSGFHRLVADRFDPEAVAADFGPYRFATNVLYQVLLICDVTPIERYLAAHLLTRAVARRTGTDWQALAATVVA